MAIQDALTFLSQARRDDDLVEAIAALGEDATLDSLAEVAGRAGHHFTPEELGRAHALDWRLRWASYSSKALPD